MIKAFSLGIFLLVCSDSLFADTRVWDFNDIEPGSTPAGWKIMSAESSPSNATVDHDGTPTVTWAAKEVTTVPGASEGNMVMSLTAHNGSSYEYGHHCWTDELEFSDGTIEVDMAAHDGKKGHMGIAFRIQDKNTYYAIRFQSNNGDVQTIDVKDGVIQYRTSSTRVASLAGYDIWRKLKVVVEGANIKVFVDDQQYLDYTDDTDPITAAGGFGLFSRGDVSLVSFDNFSVTAENIASVKPNQ